MFKNLDNFKNTIILATAISAVPSYAFEDSPSNYVELGTMRSESSFEVIGQGQEVQIPIFKKEDYEHKAVGDISRPSYQDISINRTGQSPKAKSISPLAKKLRAMKIIPIPRYNFGREKILKSKDIRWKSFESIGSFSLKKKKAANPLSRLKEVVSFRLVQADEKKINFKNADQKVTTKGEVDAIVMTKLDNFNFTVIPMELRKPKDHELLAADILFEEKNSCEEVVPISQILEDKKTVDNRVKFYKGICLHDAKMYSESIPLLSEVIGTSTDYYAKKAVDKILDGLPRGYESIIAQSLAPKNVYNKLNQKQKDKYNYILSKGHFINEKYKRAEAHAKLVSSSSPDYNDAQFVVATSQYMSGRLRAGISTMAQLKEQYSQKLNKNNDFMTLINITYARFLFERGAYKEAIENYDLISREHSLWVDSLIEKGWAQIKLGDYKGAIGNMYTLHSPFFRDAFIPESYVIRTIGYLNLCQFGDADHTLRYLETAYPEQKKGIEAFIGAEKDHYQTLLDYLASNPSKNKGQSHNGLQNAIVKEMGRDKDFLVIQSKLNNIVDEIPMFRAFASEVIGKRSKLVAEINGLTAKSRELKQKEGEALKNGETLSAKEYKKQRKSVFEEGFALTYRISLFDRGIVSYKQANGDAIKRAEKMRDGFLVQAEGTLQKSLQNIEARLNTVLTNNDLLRYEVYANSGKNIRFRVAGGQVGKEENAQARKLALESEDKKDYGWKFQGEFWQDEIGSFRSTLKNMCPKN